WSSNVEQLKTLNTADVEVGQLVKLKQAGISDDACVTLISGAHRHQHQFASADSAINLARAGYSEPVILEIAKTDQLDSISGDAKSNFPHFSETGDPRQIGRQQQF